MSMAAIFAVWMVAAALGMPVGYTLILASTAFFIAGGNTLALNFAMDQMLDSINNFILLAVPFFVLTGNIMNGGGVTDRIFTFAKALVGHFQGGLAHVNIFASLVFSGMSGSALADAGGLGQLEIKSMRDAGYDDSFAGGITAASCIIGPIIPPSTSLIVYAVVANQSVEQLFIAGFLPGVLIALMLMIMSSIIAKRRGYPREPRPTLREIVTAFRRAFLALMTPVIILYGIFAGVFTPTEAAVVAATYSSLLGFFVYRELTLRKFYHIVVDSVKTAGTIALLVLGVSIFGWIIAREQMPQAVAKLFLTYTDSPITLLFMINLLLLFLGMFIDALPLLVVLVPILLPTVTLAGVNLVHFGLVVVFNLMIGILTPPMGTALFVVCRVGNIPFKTMVRGVVPFLIPLVITLVLLTVFPEISLFLPRLLTGR